MKRFDLTRVLRIIGRLGAALVLTIGCLAEASVPSAAAQSPEAVPLDGPAPSELSAPQRLQVLFLGDDGHHEPSKRALQILPYMAERGIHVFYTDRLEALNSETLGKYDVLAMYGNHPHLSPGREAALLDFVAQGGGLVAIHAASAMFGNSDAFISLVGGAFKSHGADSFRTRILRPDHPTMHGVPNFESWDETYVHMKHNPDKEVLSVRVANGREEPWTWVRSHGDGRVFYTAWGHDERTWSNPGFHKLFEQGIRWAAGDWALTADLAPPALDYMEGTVPNYPPGVGWGVTGDPINRVQKPLSPEESMRQTAVEPGFRLELFAAEPDLVNPIDMAWDERGRLWVVETVDYPNEFSPERRGSDRIKILEDTDGDGRADRATVFAGGMNIPTSLIHIDGGVVVAQAPDMLFLKDTDGDDRADVTEVLFTGWGTFDTHAGPNNLRYGLDNQIWGAVGYSGFHGAVEGDTIRIPQGFYRFAPDGSRLESMAWTNNNTWGLGFSEEGLVFASTANRNPSNFMAIPNRYFARLKGHDGGGSGGDNDGIPVLHPIADEATFYPITSDVRQVDQHGTYTSGAGHEIYTARNFPRAYWNRAAFVSGPTGHLLGRFFLEPEGSDYRARNDWNMVASRDAWFAPIQAKVGPDGALWVIDWYNLIIQHNPTPPGFETGEGNAYETDLRDRQHSRIYRIVYEDAPSAAEPFSLGDATPEDLVRALRDDNMFWRLTAQRLLVQRGHTDVLPHLYGLVNDERVDELGLNVGAIHALWTMHGLGALDGGNREALDVAFDALRHPSAGVRRAAVMVLPADAGSLDALFRMGLLPDRTAPEGTFYMVDGAAMAPAEAQVRLAVLLAVADMPESDRAGEALAEIALVPEYSNDRWLRFASVIAAARHSEAFLRRVLKVSRSLSDSTYAANVHFVVRTVAADYAARLPAGDVGSLLAALSTADPLVAGAFLDGLIGGWPEGDAPVLTSEVRAALRSASREFTPEIRDRLLALAKHWGHPDILAEQ